MCFKRQVCFLLFLVSLFFVFSENKSVTSAWQEELYEMEEIEDFRGDIEDIITLNGEMLVSYKDYYYVEGRDKSYYLSVKYGIFWDIYAIEPGYEIQSIKKDDGKYYAILWSSTGSYLAEKSNEQAEWKNICSFTNDNSKQFTLYAKDKKICVVSDNKIYLNLDWSSFKEFDIPDFKSSDRIRNPSVAISKNNTLYLGNDFGEWGGNLYKVVYDSKSESLKYDKIFDVGIDKIVTNENDVYALFSMAHGLTKYAGIYKINDDVVETIFYKETWIPIRANMTFPDDMNVDTYGWIDLIDGNLIKDIEFFDNKLVLLISDIGIYYINNNNELEMIKELPFPEEKYIVNTSDSPYNVLNSVEKLCIEDDTFFVIYRLPVIFSTKVSFE